MLDFLDTVATVITLGATLGTALVAALTFIWRGRRKVLPGAPEVTGQIPPPPVIPLVNRLGDLAAVRAHLRSGSVRVVSVVGGGGIGKTALVAKLTRELVDHSVGPAGRLLRRHSRRASEALVLDRVHWTTLRLRPRASEFTADVVLSLAGHHLDLAHTLTGRVDQLIALMRESRCLLVLDNAESVLALLDAADRTFRDEYVYLLRSLVDTSHRSLVLVTSRISVEEHVLLRGDRATHAEVRLAGLAPSDAHEMFGRRLAHLREDGLAAHNRRSSAGETDPPGNPLLIELLALQATSTLRAPATLPTLRQEAYSAAFGEVIQWYMEQFSPTMRRVALQVALAAEPVTLDSVRDQLLGDLHPQDLALAASSLEFALGLRQHPSGAFSFHQVVAEALADWLVQACVRELVEQNFDLLRWVLLQSSRGSEQEQRFRQRQVITPVLDRLAHRPRDPDNTTDLVVSAFRAARGDIESTPGCNLASNIVTLLLTRQERCSGIDMSRLLFRDVDFSRSELHGCDLSDSTFDQCTFIIPHGAVLDTGWSTDETSVAAVDSLGNLLVWSAGELRDLQRLRISRTWLRGVRFVRGADLAAGGDDSEMIIVAGAGIPGRELTVTHRLKLADMHWIRSVDAVPDHEHFFTGSEDGSVRRWSIEGSQIALGRTWSTDGGAVRAVRTLDGVNAVAALSDGRLAVLTTDAVRHKRVGEFQVRCIDVHRGRLLVAACTDDTGLSVTDLADGALVTARHGEGAIRTLCWSADGRFVLTAGDDGVVWSWPVADDGPPVLGEPAAIATFDDRVLSIQTSQSGRTLAVSTEGEATFFVDLPTGAVKGLSRGCTRRFWSLSPAPDGRHVVSGSEDRRAHVWQVEDDFGLTEVAALRHGGRVWRVCYSMDGRRIITACDDNNVRIWDAERHFLLSEMVGHRDWVLDVRTHLYEDREYILSCGNDRTVGVWDLAGRHVAWRSHHEARVLRLASWRDGLAVSTSSDEGVTVFDPLTGEVQGRHTLPGHRAWGLAADPDRGELATGGDDGRIVVWDLIGSRAPLVLATLPDSVLEVRYCSDGELLVVGSLISGGLRAFRRDADEWTEADLVGDHRVRALCELPRSSVLLAAGSDEVIAAYGLPDLEFRRETRRAPFYSGSSFARSRRLTPGERMSLSTLGATGLTA